MSGSTGTVPAGGSTGTASVGGSTATVGSTGMAGQGATEPEPFELLGAPLLFAPTDHGFGLSVVLASGDPSALRARVRLQAGIRWGEFESPEVRADDLAEWQFEGLEPGTPYEYTVVAETPGGEELLYEGSVITQRPPGESYSFAMLSDTHIGPDLSYSNQGYPETLEAVSAEIGEFHPDFVLHLGDTLDFHEYGFNPPPPNGTITRAAYLNYRMLMGDTLGNVAHFPVIGNWDGENGSFSAEEIAWSREQRQLYNPGPNPMTYPEGGGPNEDYYAFTWGDALFVVLNVMSYTTTAHVLNYGEDPEAWTLGSDQLAYLETTLQQATAKWRFLFIHHAVGGAGPDAANAAYGRGGGLAAHVGEQEQIHQLMLDYGVQIFFYGHDHVFTDIVVDGIHYSDPGSAGAPWKFDESETGYTEYWSESGWARVDVTPDSLDVQFIAMGGTLLHEYTVE